MLCEKCGKNTATTHIRTIVNGVVRETNLCEHCANANGYMNISHNNLAGMLASMFGESVNTKFMTETKRCPICNSAFSDIAETGRVGCAECYKTFNSQLLPYLKRVHGSTKHIGKIPNSAPLVVKETKESVESLRLELNRLVSEEKYEEAAVIRDKIKKMEGEKS